MLVYTSITKSYLPKARVLAKSIKQFHPDWTVVVLCSDNLPIGFDLATEPFDELLTIDQLEIPNWKSWAFGHQLVELCTAVKGPAAEYLAQRPTVDKIMYLDPDIKVFQSLSPLESLLDQHDILLTPHLLDAEQDVTAIQDYELCVLKHGIYNLGFFAANTSGQGIEFIRWWAKRLRLFCRDDIPEGLFTDQRWCDLAPALFSQLGIIRDRGYNVATWNIAHRPFSQDASGALLVAGVPLRFYHFSSYDNGKGLIELHKNAKKQTLAHQIWQNYGDELRASGQGDTCYNGWFWGQFDNGEAIPAESRKHYHNSPHLQQVFPNPYSTVEPCYLSWWQNHSAATQRKRTHLPHLIRRLARSALTVFKREGLFGLIRQSHRRAMRLLWTLDKKT